MKAVRSNKLPEQPEEQPALNWKAQALELESSGNNAAAIKLYENAIRTHAADAFMYDRLMILFRKEKAYEKELALINNAIRKFTEILHPQQHRHAVKVAQLSKSILKAVGLSDKKGRSLYTPQPIARWEKRKANLQKRLAGRIKTKKLLKAKT